VYRDAILKCQLSEKVEALAFGTVLLGGLVSLLRAALWAPLPFQLNFAEGPFLGVAVRIVHGYPTYPPATTPPYIINPYGPVPYYLVAMLVRIFGVGFTAPRVLVIASAIGCAVLVALLVRRMGGSISVGLVFGALFLTMPAVQKWLSVLRVDMIAVAFSLIGIYLFIRFDRPYLSVIPFGAAFFCKFTFVAAPAACFLYSLSKGETKKTAQFVACYIMLAGGAFFLLQVGTGGWFGFDTIWVSRYHPFLIRAAVTEVLRELRDCSLLLLFVVLTIWVGPGKLLRNALHLPAIYLTFSFFVMFLRGKAGAGSNYFLEWEAALCLCAGIAYSFMRRESNISSTAKIAVLALLAILVLTNVAWVSMHRLLPQYNSVSGCRDAYQYVKNHAGDRILSENVGAVVLAGKLPGVFEPFMWARQVVGAGWSDAEVVNMIRSRQFDLILLNGEAVQTAFDPQQGRWSPSSIEAIEKNYKVARSFVCVDANVAYEPKTPR
jgi:hypothetical protein